MAKIKVEKRNNWLTVFCFQLCVVANNLFSYDEQLFVVSKLATLLFFGVVLLRILQRGRIMYNHVLLLPIAFTAYCFATVLWAYQPNRALTQMVTQVQLLLLLLFTFWAMNDGVTLMDYLKALYVSGFGMLIFLVVRQGGIMQYINAMLAGERMGGAYANPYGMVFGNAALCAAYYMILRGRKKHLISLLLFTFFALSSASRKAMLMIVIGVVAISVLHYGWNRIYRTLLAGIALVFVGYFILRLPYFSEIRERFLNLITGEQDMSDIERNQMVKLGLDLFQEKPVFGYGIGNYAALCFRETYSHNNYVELLVSGGVIALVMYYLMPLVPALGLLEGKRRNEKIEPLHLMLYTWLTVELVFGVAMVQLYNKNSWLLMGVLMAEAAHAPYKRRMLQEKQDEIIQKNQEGTA